MTQHGSSRTRHKRCCLLIIVAGAAVSLGGAEPPAQQGRGKTSQQQRSVTPQPVSTPAPASAADPSPNFRPYPDYYSERCYSANDHDASDLCAYWRSAIAAEKAAHEARRANFWSIVASALSFATVVGLIVSIRQTNGALREARRGNRITLLEQRRTWRESRDATSRADDALEISRKNAAAVVEQVDVLRANARSELRAYVAVERITAPRLVFGETPAFVIDVRNFGHTPAIDYNILSWVTVAEKARGDSLIGFPKNAKVTPSSLAPGATGHAYPAASGIWTQQLNEAFKPTLFGYF